MRGGAAAALAAAGVLAALDWWAVARGARRVEYVAKPATLAALVVAAALVDATDPDQRPWFLAGLALSLLGDVFLMLPRDAFVAGLGSFLLAHVAYTGGLGLEGQGAGALAVSALGVAGVAVVLGGRIVLAVRRGPHPGLAGPVTAYLVVISAMVAAALATADPGAAGGAALFYASDFLIGWSRFVAPDRAQRARVAIMVTYHLGQAGLVVSLLI